MTRIVSQLMSPPTCTFFDVSLPQVKCCEKVLMNELSNSCRGDSDSYNLLINLNE